MKPSAQGQISQPFPIRMRRILAITAIVVLGLLALVFLGLRWLEPAMIYHPVSEIDTTPAQGGMAYREVEFPTADGETLHGWWIPAREEEDEAEADANTGPVLLFFHGNAGNREHRLYNVLGLHKAGIPVFIFDYRGFGGSSGTPSEAGLIRDGEAAHDWLRGEVGERPIVYFGRSLGGAVAANVALSRPAAGLILESTFTNIPRMARRVLPIPGIGLLVRSRFDALAAVGSLTLPLVIIHGDADELIPFSMGRELFAASASTDRAFHAVAGGRHNDTFERAGEAYYPWIASFLKRLTR